MRNGQRLPAHIGALFLTLFLATHHLPSVHAAAHDSKEVAALQKEAVARKYVRVMVDMGIKVPLQSADKHSADLRAQLQAREDAIVEELGVDVLRATVWRNGLGQLGLHVTIKGLNTLAASKNAASLTRDPTDDLRTTVYKADGRLAKIEAEIARNGFADVEVGQNLDNFEFDLAEDGRVSHRPDQSQAAEVASKRASLLNRLPAGSVVDLQSAKAKVRSAKDPMFQLRINKEGFLALIEHDEIRSLRLASASEVEPPDLDPEALTIAQKHGYATVAIDLQRFAGYSPHQKKLPEAAWKAQDAAIKRAFAQILERLPHSSPAEAKYIEGIATVFVRLPLSAIERLYSNPDPRIRSVHASQARGGIALAQSTQMINVPQGWNIGLRGAGQIIAVLDSGVDRNHPFLSRANGTSKVINEACVSAAPGHPTHSNICGIAPNSNGDAVGFGAATPCSHYGATECQHGTHVAGIAVGRQNSGAQGASGVAPEADLLPVTVMSKRRSDGALNWFDGDVSLALGLLSQTGLSNLTVNMSIQTYSAFTLSCDGAYIGFSYSDSVARLTSLTVPVVAATGNQGYRDRISFPACLNSVIKVGSTDDSAGIGQPSWFSNIANPALFGGYFLMAPGDPITSSTSFVSGSLIAYPYGDMSGTSMAAPHVAGFFAMVKAAVPGASVANIAAYLFNTGVPISSPYSTGLRRVRLQDF
jgi:subtilisin family serine protease